MSCQNFHQLCGSGLAVKLPKRVIDLNTIERSCKAGIRLIETENEVVPRTFQQAVELARALDLTYLWIVSICIMQDPEEDWQIPSSSMGEIYRNGFLTIAAVSSPDFRHGCCPLKPKSDICLPVTIDENTELVVAARESTPGDPAEQLPLLTRAWVYQERMLSRRVLLCN